MGSRSQSTKKHWWNTEEFCLILHLKCITTSLNYCMGISSMQSKQAESFAKDTLSCVLNVVQVWKLLSFTCELLYIVFVSYGISVSSSALMSYCKMDMCSDQSRHKKFSDCVWTTGHQCFPSLSPLGACKNVCQAVWQYLQAFAAAAHHFAIFS